jgi:hypothetical protein
VSTGRRRARWRGFGFMVWVHRCLIPERDPGEQALKERSIFWLFRGSIIGFAAQTQQNRRIQIDFRPRKCRLASSTSVMHVCHFGRVTRFASIVQ